MLVLYHDVGSVHCNTDGESYLQFEKAQYHFKGQLLVKEKVMDNQESKDVYGVKWT